MEKKVLGLDLGTNSIGWCLTKQQQDENLKWSLDEILGIGSRIIPMNEKVLNEYESGKQTTKNSDRRRYRGARRLLQRYHLRRDLLVRVLNELHVKDPGKEVDYFKEVCNQDKEFQDLVKEGQIKPAWYLYYLRDRGVKEKLTLDQLGLVLYHLNQRRGYKDLGELMDELAGINEKEEKNSRTYYEIATISFCRPSDDKNKGKVIYDIGLSNGILGTTLVSALTEFVGEEMELEIREKSSAKSGVSYEIALPRAEEWKYRLEGLAGRLNDSGKTPGQYFFEKLKSDSTYRVKQNLVYRDKYLEEFDRIMACQEEYHSVLKDKDFYQKILLLVIPNNTPLRNQWVNKNFRLFLRNYIIYFQRPLKSKKSSIGLCRFEKGIIRKDPETGIDKVIRKPYVAPISSPWAQELKVWQTIAHLSLRDSDNEDFPLSESEKERLYTELLVRPKLTSKEIVKLLKGERKDIVTTTLPEGVDLAGNNTYHQLRKALVSVSCPQTDILKDIEEQFRIWHLLYSVPSVEIREKTLMKRYAFSKDDANALAKVKFPVGHANLSVMALKKIVPLMRSGKYYDVSSVDVKIIEKIERWLGGRLNDLEIKVEKTITQIIGQKDQVESFRGMKYWDATYLAYGDHRATEDRDAYESPSDIQFLPLNSVRNPIVEQIVNETLKVIKEIWSVYGKPDKIVVEMARSLKMTSSERQDMTKRINKRAKVREDIAEKLRKEYNIPNPSRRDILKYNLWVEQGERCLYSGAVIQSSDLFSGATDVDHIIPRQRYFDDSNNNKVLAFKRENQMKNNLTAFEYMKAKGETAFESFKLLIKNLEKNRLVTKAKANNLLAEEVPSDFVERQLNDTRYISRIVVRELELFCPGAVRFTIGAITDHLKDIWNVNEIFKELQLPRFERLERKFPEVEWIKRENKDGHQYLSLYNWDKRIDHRHHALDALIIACTSDGIVNQLNHLNSQFGSLQQNGVSSQRFPYPCYHFKEKVGIALSNIVVSVKSTQKVVTTRRNYYKKYDSEAGRYIVASQEKKTYSIRGALHDELPLGEIKRQVKVPLVEVLKKLAKRPNLINESDSDKKYLVLEWQRVAIQDHLTIFGGDYEKLLKGLKKMPLVARNGKRLDEVTVWKRFYTKTRTIDVNLTKPQIESIIDPTIKRELTELLANYGGDPKKALTADNLMLWNRGRKVPVYKTKCFVDTVEVGDTTGRFLHSNNPEKRYKKYVEAGDNFAVLVFEDNLTFKRETEIIQFATAVGTVLEGFSINQDYAEKRSFLLRKNDIVYVPYKDENVEILDFSNPSSIIDRLYILMKMSGNRFYFLPCTTAKVMNIKLGEAKDYNEFGSASRTEFHEFGHDDRLRIIDFCLPVTLDRIGRISKIGF